jgi:hypothetical protein
MCHECAKVSRFRRLYRLADGSKRKKISALKKSLSGIVVPKLSS